MELFEDIETRNGVIPMMTEAETFPPELQEAAKLVFGENFRGVSENGLMMDEFGNAYEAEPMTVEVRQGFRDISRTFTLL